MSTLCPIPKLSDIFPIIVQKHKYFDIIKLIIRDIITLVKQTQNAQSIYVRLVSSLIRIGEFHFPLRLKKKK